MTLSMRVGYVIPPTQLILHTRHTDLYTYIHISREISIEHPSVGLASLAQIIHHFATPTYPLPSRELEAILQSSLLQRFTSESNRELSALRKLNNKQRQVSMFLFKLLTQFPFVSFLSISIPSLLRLSIFSLLPLQHPFFSSNQFFVLLR